MQAYSEPCWLSLFGCGHHHQARLSAVIAAIQKSTPEQAIRILNHQIILMTENLGTIGGGAVIGDAISAENIVNPEVLDLRWQAAMPGHRALTRATQARSLYLRALQQALTVVKVAAASTPDEEKSLIMKR